MKTITNNSIDPMDIAIKEAKKAYLLNEVPVGAVITDKHGNVIAKAFNLVEKYQDPTAHAEMLVIKEATLKIKNKYFAFSDNNGTEKFRIINALNPGTFENDTKTFAIVVVADLSVTTDPLITVKKMIEFCINFSEKFHASLCDEERTPITKQMISHIESKAQDIERINQLKRTEN